MRSILLVCCFNIVFHTPISGASYFISPAGNDNCTGTSEKAPWRTIEKLNRFIQTKGFKAGDKVLFRGSFTYTGSISITADQPFIGMNMGTPKAPIVISSYGKGLATIYSGDSYGLLIQNGAGYEVSNLLFRGSGGENTALNGKNKENGIVFYNDRKDSLELRYIRMESLDVSGYQRYGILVCAGKTASIYRDVTITHCQSHDNGEGGISSYSQVQYSIKNLVVSYCIAYQNSGITSKLDNHSGNGIVMAAVDGGVIEYNEAYCNGWLNPCDSGGPIGIWVWHSNNILMQYNEAHHNYTNSLKDGGGFDFDGGTNHSIMQYNYSHDNDGAGYLVAQFWGAFPMANNIVRYNISQNDGRKNGYGGITLWGGDRFSDCEVYNNIVFMNSEHMRDSMVPAAVQFLGDHFDRVHLRNNIFITDGKCWIIHADTASVTSRNALFQNNCYYSVNNNLRIKWGHEIFNDFEAWKKKVGDQESIGGKEWEILKNPRLKDPGNAPVFGNPVQLSLLDQYKLLPGSPLIDAGLNIAIPEMGGFDAAQKDFYGNSLPLNGKIDVGIYEKK